ncbi:hypothetical protein M3Y97_00772100 [Aphelenchoides bicaudatus]|nr:hypothetical protein M3Y97_00772100 [Aphelenchoides bicaudatus]
MCAHSTNLIPFRSIRLASSSLTMQSLLCTFLALLTSLNAIAADVKPKVFDPHNVDPALLVGGESPNLRKILYPTYFSRDPFEMEKWQFYDGNGANRAYVNGANPMSNFFDRNLRSADYVIIEQAEPVVELPNQVKFESREKPEFVFDQPNVLPFYSGRGRR